MAGTFHSVSYKLLKELEVNISLKQPNELKTLFKSIYEKRVFMDTNAMYASLIVIVLLGTLVDYLFSVFENKTLKKWGMI